MGASLVLSPGGEPVGSVGGPRVGVVAHRGAGGGSSPADRPPENTLEACRWGWARAPWVECDVVLSGDGVAVVTHDFTTGRLADRKVVVAESTLEELKTLDMGSWKDPRWKGLQMPTLAEVLEAMPGDRGLVIEIKSGPEAAAPVAQAIKAAAAGADQVMIISFNLDTMREMKRRCPGMATLWLMSFKHEKGETEPGTWRVKWRVGPGRGVEVNQAVDMDELIAVVRREGFDGVDTTAAQPPGFPARLEAAGLYQGAWTINDPAVAAGLARSGVDEITTDDPEAIRTALQDAGFQVGRWNRHHAAPATSSE